MWLEVFRMNLSEPKSSLNPAWASRLTAALLLVLLGVGMVVSDPYFTFFDDEVHIICAAANPAAHTVDLFLHGEGQHEHPPLYDLFLHGWERITGSRMRLLRFPSIAFYLLGIWILVETARGQGGDRAATAVLWVCLLWPYGFHFGRIAAWYSLSFLLVAILTYIYLSFLKARTFKNWLLLIIPAILLLYTNYFGWAILACLMLDFLLQTRNEPPQYTRRVLLTILLLVVFFLPLIRAFVAEIQGAAAVSRSSMSGLAALEAFNLYALFASESVAPWHWALGVPVCVAIVVCIVVVLWKAPPAARRLFVYFLLLITGMSVIGIVGTKRLLLISALVVLPVGLGLGTIRSKRVKACLVVSLLIIAGVGWYGTVSRRNYSAPRFIEPWNEVAAEMAEAVRKGGVVIAYHPSFFFYLAYDLHRHGTGNNLDLARVYPYQGIWPDVYDSTDSVPPARLAVANVFLVKDVSSGDEPDENQQYLSDHCTLEDVDRMLPDSGFSLKERLLPGIPRARYRIELFHYNCAKPTGHKPSVASGSSR